MGGQDVDVEGFFFSLFHFVFLTDHQKGSGEPKCPERVLRVSCTLKPSNTLLVI